MNSFTFIGIGNLARNPEVTAKGDAAYVRFCLVGADHAEPDEEVGHAREIANSVCSWPSTRSLTASLRMLGKGISLLLRQGFVRVPGPIGKATSAAAISSS